MLTQIRKRTEEYKVYVANDGTEFSTEMQCVDYENNKDKTLVFVLIEKSYGRHGETVIGVFSTEEKALKWIENWVLSDKHQFYVRPEYIDGKDR